MPSNRGKCKEEYDKTYMPKTAMTWHIFKRAYDLGYRQHETETETLNQPEE